MIDEQVKFIGKQIDAEPEIIKIELLNYYKDNGYDCSHTKLTISELKFIMTKILNESVDKGGDTETIDNIDEESNNVNEDDADDIIFKFTVTGVILIFASIFISKFFKIDMLYLFTTMFFLSALYLYARLDLMKDKLSNRKEE